MKRIIIIFAVLIFLIVVASTGMTTMAQSGDPGPPWICDGSMYLVQGNGSTSTLSKVDTTTSPWTLTPLLVFDGTSLPALDLNALAFNPVDYYMYAMNPGNGHIYRIGQSGAEDLGVPSGFPGGTNWFSGTFVYDPGPPASNPVYVANRDSQDASIPGGNPDFPILRINVSGSTPTILSSGNLWGKYTDIAFNPSDGYIYALRERNGPETTYKINPGNFSEIIVGTGVGSSNKDGIWAAAFADSANQVFFYNIATFSGADPIGFYSTNLSTGELTFDNSAEQWSRADGANCPLVPMQVDKDYGDLPDGPYNTTLASGGPSHVILDGHPMLGSTIDLEYDGQPTTATDGDDANGDTPDDEDGVVRAAGLNGATNGGGWTNGTVANGNGGALQITVAGASGIVQVWMDFGDGNGLTEVTLLDNAGAAISQPLAIGSHTVYFDVPTGIFDGTNSSPIYTRVRISTNGGLGTGGEADDGEVEDYVFHFGPNVVTLRSIFAQGESPPSQFPVILLLAVIIALSAGGVFLRRRSRL